MNWIYLCQGRKELWAVVDTLMFILAWSKTVHVASDKKVTTAQKPVILTCNWRKRRCWEILDCHSGVFDESGLVGSDAVYLGDNTSYCKVGNNSKKQTNILAFMMSEQQSHRDKRYHFYHTNYLQCDSKKGGMIHSLTTLHIRLQTWAKLNLFAVHVVTCVCVCVCVCVCMCVYVYVCMCMCLYMCMCVCVCVCICVCIYVCMYVYVSVCVYVCVCVCVCMCV